MIRFLHIIRWKNLLMIAFVQVLIKFNLMPLFKITDTLSNWQFVLLVFASVLIAAGGYIINDIQDIETDKINKPTKVWIPTFMKIENARFLCFSISLLGLLLGVILCILLQSIQSFIWFLIPVLLLYLYAARVKRILILGNLLVSLLVAFSLFIIVFFETNITYPKSHGEIDLIDIIWTLMFFAFVMTLIREIIKDVEDVKGDKATGVISIPIKYGIENTKTFIRGLIGALYGVIGAIAITQFEHQPFLVGYLIFVVLLSLLLFLFQLKKAKFTSDFKKLSTLLKIIMIIGIFSVFLIRPV